MARGRERGMIPPHVGSRVTWQPETTPNTDYTPITDYTPPNEYPSPPQPSYPSHASPTRYMPPNRRRRDENWEMQKRIEDRPKSYHGNWETHTPDGATVTVFDQFPNPIKYDKNIHK